MSCSKFKLMTNPVLNEVINRKVGSDIVEYTNLVALTNNRVYKEFIVRNGIDPIANPEAAYEMLLKAREIVLGKLNDKVAATERREKGFFTSYEARQTALNYCAAKICEYNFVYTKNGEKFTFETFQKKLNEDVVKILENRGRRIAKSKGLEEQFNTIFSMSSSEKFDKLTSFVVINGSEKDSNFARLARSLATNDKTVNNSCPTALPV